MQHSAAMNGSALRVVIIDDQAEFLDAAVAVMGLQPNVEVIDSLMSGRLALQRLPGLDPDLILVDLMMPQMNGLELTRRIRRAGMRTHIVVISVYDTDGYALAATEAGADGFISKIAFVREFGLLVNRLRSGAA
jgi:DNA-binding NarL/FixJ family response regulator